MTQKSEQAIEKRPWPDEWYRFDGGSQIELAKRCDAQAHSLLEAMKLIDEAIGLVPPVNGGTGWLRKAKKWRKG